MIFKFKIMSIYCLIIYNILLTYIRHILSLMLITSLWMLIMHTVTIILLSGFVATLIMIGIMELVTRSQLANADMVRAIGSIFTKSYINSLKPGLLIHFTSGVIFAFAYFLMFNLILPDKLNLGAVVGLAIGFFHGMVITLALVNLVIKYHPVQRFRIAGFYMALAHIIGHMIYGLTLGVMYSFTGSQIL